MARQLETRRVLYVDLELTCWDDRHREDAGPEIIQIGLVEADLLKLKITRQESYFVRPIHSTLSTFCIEFTGITPEVLKKQGRKLPEVIRSIEKKYGPDGKVCFTWGNDSDALEEARSQVNGDKLFEECIFNPFHMTDLGHQFRMEMGLKQAPSLGNALKMVGIEFEGRPHNALTDARNTARFHMERLRQQRAWCPVGDEVQPHVEPVQACG